MKYYIGLDIGSVSTDITVVNEDGDEIETRYVRTHGDPLKVTLKQLEDIMSSFDGEKYLAVTGNAGKVIAKVLNAPFVNEIVAQSNGAMHHFPEVNYLIEIGGEDSKLVRIEQDEDGGGKVVDFSLNSICAAGTGSFLDQQAGRLKVSIEEFSELALKSESPPRVAGRCSVFAKSDMIHLQQQGTPDYDIIAGLCFAMARNFKGTLSKGKEIAPPVVFQGGVAHNKGMIRAFKETLGLHDDELLIPDNPGCTGALGAALEILRKHSAETIDSLAPFKEHINKKSGERAERLEQLQDDGYEIDTSCKPLPEGTAPIDAYVGVDIGSISTNAVVIDSDLNVLARCYLMTEGRPIEAVKKALYEVGTKVEDKVTVKGCCTTGSGRYLIGEFVGADIVKNEITTHARGATAMDPNVDTIFEIGGQDAKYVSLENGAVVDFAMNKVCAAGTGSFLEEQAERLDLKIEEEFGRTALSSEKPAKMGERCTVFMESDLNYYQHQGLPRQDLVGGLCYSIVFNYLNRVVEDRKVGDHIFFQGGVAFNRGVKAAFEKITGKKIIVPPHQDVMGAYGAAIIARQDNEGDSNFKGFDLRETDYELKTFECKSCSNRCEVHRVSIEGQPPLHYGSRCGKFDDQKKYRKGEHLPKPFEERHEMLLNSYPYDEPVEPLDVTIGIPRALTFYDQYPLWKAFFTEMGCHIKLSDPTNRKIISEGGEHITTETCFPIKVAHGHVADLVEKKVDYIFLPSVINMEAEADQIVHHYLCPLVQSLPYAVRFAFSDEEQKGNLPLISPILHFEKGREHISEKLRDLAQMFEVAAVKTEKAIEEAWKAYDKFKHDCVERGRELLENLGDDETALAIMSRPYNGCDPGMNLAISEKLRNLGAMALPIDFLPLDLSDIQDEFPHMYWKYGQKIIAAGQFVAEHPNLHAVYITNFRCGPDSFISKFFDRVIGEPYLTLEIDEHSADVGAITRCEAFLDSLQTSERRKTHKKARGEDIFFDLRKSDKKMKVYIPYMDDHCLMMQGVLRSNGVDAEALPMSDHKSLELGRKFTSGKECYPCILTTGDIVRKTLEDDFNPETASFFMAQANGPCRFGQYHKFHRMVLDDLGYENIPMVVMDQTEDFVDHVESFGADFYRKCWELVLIVDFMQKILRERRPYEVHAGDMDKVYQQGLQELAGVAEKGGNYYKKAEDIRRRFDSVEIDRSQQRPVIGVVGEIYVRSNPFANNFLVRRLEKYGAQVILPPFQEWLNYIAWDRRDATWQNAKVFAFAKEWLTEFSARWMEGKIAKIFNGAIEKMHREEPIADVIQKGSYYLDPSIKGEAVLSLGRSVEYAEHGFNGVVNVSPFGCMPGAMVNSLIEKFRGEHQIPVIKMDFDGLQQASEDTALEAFVHQAREHMQKEKPLKNQVKV